MAEPLDWSRSDSNSRYRSTSSPPLVQNRQSQEGTLMLAVDIDHDVTVRSSTETNPHAPVVSKEQRHMGPLYCPLSFGVSLKLLWRGE